MPVAHRLTPVSTAESRADDHPRDPLVQHAAALLAELDDPARPGLERTPQRLAAALRFLTSGAGRTLEDVVGKGLFPAEDDGVVLVRDIQFHSLCEHHVLPFFGVAHVAYLPGEKIIGLSKIPRLVELYSRRLQVQERLTAQIADALVEALQPRGVAVVLSASHLCMAMRGVQESRASTTTRALRGACREEPVRSDVLALLTR